MCCNISASCKFVWIGHRIRMAARDCQWAEGVLWANHARSEIGSTPRARSMQARRRAGLVVSPGRLLQDQLVQGQIRHRTAKPGVLRLEIPQALDLVALQAAKLLAPPVISHLAHPA